MSAMASQITDVSIVAQAFVQAQIKENIKAMSNVISNDLRLYETK